jgi:hypothetical protein
MSCNCCPWLCRTVLTRTFDGLSKGYKGSLVPVLSTEMSLFDAVRKLDHLQGSVLPTSSRKISHCKVGGWAHSTAQHSTAQHSN